MSGEGRPEYVVEGATGMKVAIVAASWHENIMEGLIAGATKAIANSGAQSELIRVAGSFELSVVALAAARNGYDAVVALGVIVKGSTDHYEWIARAATEGLLRASMDTGVPIGFGVLTTQNEIQAVDRAGLAGSHEDKGGEAAAAALGTAVILRDLRPAGA